MGGDAAIFGSGAVKHTLLLAAAATGGGDHPSRSHVARESAAFRLLPFTGRVNQNRSGYDLGWYQTGSNLKFKFEF